MHEKEGTIIRKQIISKTQYQKMLRVLNLRKGYYSSVYDEGIEQKKARELLLL